MRKSTQDKTILIVEDHPVFRQGLRSIVDSIEGGKYRIVGEAVTAKDGFNQVGDLKPQLALVDISLPGNESGIMLTRKISAHHPKTKVLIISMHSKIDYVTEAFKAGANGFLCKDSASEQLPKAIGMVLGGKKFIDPNLSDSIIDNLIDTPSQVDDSYAMLTNREQEVFRLLALGDTVVKIGEKMGLSPKTIENHRSNIFKKLDFKKYYDLYQYARRIGIIDPNF